MAVFVDSCVFVAYYNARDSLHAKAEEFLKKAFGGAYGDVFTSDYVFDESVTVAAVRAGFDRAVELGEKLASSEIRLVSTSPRAFERAWALFKKYRRISFTDCAILAAMEENGIKKLLSFDAGFEKAEGIELVGTSN